MQEEIKSNKTHQRGKYIKIQGEVSPVSEYWQHFSEYKVPELIKLTPTRVKSIMSDIENHEPATKNLSVETTKTRLKTVMLFIKRGNLYLWLS